MTSKTMKEQGLLAFVLLCSWVFFAAPAWGAQEATFDWVAATDENARLDPTDYLTGPVFSPSEQGGNVHIDIDAQEPVTAEMAPAGEWSEAIRHPELLARVTFRCIREHVTKSTYVCDVPPRRPMTLVLRDERNAERTAVTAFGAQLSDGGTIREFVSPNDIHIQYYRWACVENCSPPQYQWSSELKERYELTPEPKLYEGIRAERDGQPFSIRVNSSLPLTVAILPSRVAQEVRLKPGKLDSALEGGSCVEKAVRSTAFECTFDIVDGPQTLIAVPESGNKLPTNKKAQIEVMGSKCVVNCLTDAEK